MEKVKDGDLSELSTTSGEDSTGCSSNQDSVHCRRSFLKQIGGIGALLATAGNTHSHPESPDLEVNAHDHIHRKNYYGVQRANEAYKIRVNAAKIERNVPIPDHPNNGDEFRYMKKIGNFSKGLPHNSSGEVDQYAYNKLLEALYTGKPSDFKQIPMGAPLGNRMKLVNPQAALAFDLQGTDSHQLFIPPAPIVNSAEIAGEMIEDYWMALTRDVPFNEYATNGVSINAAAELSSLSDFRGPKISGQVTPETLYRLDINGALIGPYISQFLWMIPPFGATYINASMLTATPGINFGTQYDEWLSIQNGFIPTSSITYDSQRRYIRNGRDLSTWVHIDKLFESYFNALLVMLAQPSTDPFMSGLGVPFNQANPYNSSKNQVGFGTFGGENVLTLLCEIATRALKAQWFQKWRVHRRLRPEAYGGLVHLRMEENANYPIYNEILESYVLQQVYSQYGTYLLPLAYPEGSPLHPSYGAGHATVAGACVTILKAWFDENFVIPNPVIASSDGSTLLPYDGPTLTLGGELNKLASNIALGRDHAGVHWRSDTYASLLLGEQIAISVMRDQRITYNEDFQGFTFTKFDGTQITV